MANHHLQHIERIDEYVQSLNDIDLTTKWDDFVAALNAEPDYVEQKNTETTLRQIQQFNSNYTDIKTMAQTYTFTEENRMVLVDQLITQLQKPGVDTVKVWEIINILSA